MMRKFIMADALGFFKYYEGIRAQPWSFLTECRYPSLFIWQVYNSNLSVFRQNYDEKFILTDTLRFLKYYEGIRAQPCFSLTEIRYPSLSICMVQVDNLTLSEFCYPRRWAWKPCNGVLSFRYAITFKVYFKLNCVSLLCLCSMVIY